MASQNGMAELKQTTSDIPKEVRIGILRNDMQMYKNTKWMFEQRYAVAKSLGKPQETLDAIEKDILDNQMHIAKYEELIAQVEAE